MVWMGCVADFCTDGRVYSDWGLCNGDKGVSAMVLYVAVDCFNVSKVADEGWMLKEGRVHLPPIYVFFPARVCFPCSTPSPKS